MLAFMKVSMNSTTVTNLAWSARSPVKRPIPAANSNTVLPWIHRGDMYNTHLNIALQLIATASNHYW